jgi:hypothetical protein
MVFGVKKQRYQTVVEQPSNAEVVQRIKTLLVAQSWKEGNNRSVSLFAAFAAPAAMDAFPKANLVQCRKSDQIIDEHRNRSTSSKILGNEIDTEEPDKTPV